MKIDRVRSKKWKIETRNESWIKTKNEKWETLKKKKKLSKSHKGESTLDNPFFSVTLQFSHGGVFSYKLILSQPWPRAHDQEKGLQRCGARGKPEGHISCFWECRRMWRNEHSHSQVSSQFGSWSPDGLSNIQRTIIRIKTHWIEVFFISLESS
jgi:ribosomal protein S14